MTKEERLKAEHERIMLMYETQHELSQGSKFVFGIDEAGRGPLCGPVVAACCILRDEDEILYLNDSKKISEKRREELFKQIKESALSYGIGIANEKLIDEVNILNATLTAMHEAFEACLEMYREKCSKRISDGFGDDPAALFDSIPSMSDSIFLVDGNKEIPELLFKQLPIVGGDAKCPAISAASILAKVTRDHMMLEYAEQYPEYGFAKNKGYGTKEHIEALKKYGPLNIHRRSFLKNIL